MNVKRISSELNIKPTNRKMKEAKRTLSKVLGIPKSMPDVKKSQPLSETIGLLKKNIQTKIENIRGQK